MKQQLPQITASEMRKARRSSVGKDCVRVGRKLGYTLIWDDKLAGARAADQALEYAELIYLTDDQFDAYQAAVRSGSTDCPFLSLTHRTDGLHVMRATGPQLVDVELIFNDDELNAFIAGVHAHEFDLEQFARI